jgi:methionine-rich copper-binding protein CopC
MKTTMKPLLIAGFCCVAAVSAASAHAFLDHAEPRVGSTVKVSPTEVKIWFTEGLILPFSELKVLDASGKEVEKDDKHLDPAHGEVLIVSVPPLKAGKYTVSWRVTAVDTHVTHGTFPFEVSP